MTFTNRISRPQLTLLTLFYVTAFVGFSNASPDSDIQTLIKAGSFSEAERLLRERIANRSAPVTEEAAIQLEILRRTRYDFRYSDEDILTQLRKNIPDVSAEDMARWREAGDLHFRTIDGQRRYFREAVSNLFRFSADARSRRKGAVAADKKFKIDALLEQLVETANSTDRAEIYPVKHRVTYEVAIHKGHPRLKPGTQVRAWLPFPQEYRQQRDVQLLRSEPAHISISPNGSPHRTIYFEHTLPDSPEPPKFVAEFEFVTSAYCPDLDPAQALPYDTASDLYREFTSERPPHIVFTSKVKTLTDEIVGDETNPLRKAMRIFSWVSQNVPWCSEMEYSIIPNLSAKGLAARRGDCGVQGMTFITLCRAAGVPARWQSGWQTKPGDWNMHDWSEFYVEPWGWLPADASYGLRKHDDERVRNFFCGRMDPYRLIVNLDYSRPLEPLKTSFRSEPTDFQRGEVEIDGHNLYYDEWDWTFRVETTPLVQTALDGGPAAAK